MISARRIIASTTKYPVRREQFSGSCSAPHRDELLRVAQRGERPQSAKHAVHRILSEQDLEEAMGCPCLQRRQETYPHTGHFALDEVASPPLEPRSYLISEEFSHAYLAALSGRSL